MTTTKVAAIALHLDGDKVRAITLAGVTVTVPRSALMMTRAGRDLLRALAAAAAPEA